MNQEAQRKGGRPSTITRTLGENLRSYHIPAEDARQLNERYCRKILRKYGVDTSGLSLEQQREAVITRQNELASNGQLCKWKSFKHQYDAFERRQRLCEAFVESAHRKIMQGKMCPPSEKKQRPSLLRFESPNFVEPASSVDSTRSLPRVPASVTPKSKSKSKDKNKDKDHKKKPAAGATDQDSPAANTTTATVGTFATPSSTTAVAAAATTKKKSKMLPASPKATVTPAAAAGVHKPTSKVVPRPTAAAAAAATTTGAGASATPATETVASNNVSQTPSTASTHPHPVSVAKNKQHKGTTPKDEAGHKKIPAAAIKGVHSSKTTHSSSSGPGGPPREVDSSDPSSLSESESTRSDEDNNLDNETNLDGGPRARYTGNADAPMMDVPETDDFLLAEPQDDDEDDAFDNDDVDDFNDSSSAASDSSSENEEHTTPFRSDHVEDRMQDQDDGVQDQDQDQDEDQDMFEPSAPFEIFLADRLDTLQEFTITLGEKLDNIYLTLVKQTQSKAKARRHGKGKRTVTDKAELKRGDSDDPRVSQPARVSTLGGAKVTKHKKKHNKVNNNNNKSKKEKYQVEGADL